MVPSGSCTVCCKINYKFYWGGFLTASRLNFETSKTFHQDGNAPKNRVKLVRTSNFDEKMSKKSKTIKIRGFPQMWAHSQ